MELGMSNETIKYSKFLTIFLVTCLVVILGSTVYVFSLAYQQSQSGDNYRIWEKEFSHVISQARKAVVAIKTTQHTNNSNIELNNAGSGFVFDANGYILTNEHVIHDVETIRVTLADQRQFFASVISSDPRSDLAIIKIEATDLPKLELALSGSISIGQPVAALGNPLGSGSDGRAVATFGQVIRMNQTLEEPVDTQNDRFYNNLIQTDVFILPGSSGGPLIDMQARAIGINTATGTGLQTGKHFGFAIPFDVSVVNKLVALKKGEPVQHAFLGVETTPIDQTTANKYQLKQLSGIIVKSTLIGFPAQKANLLPGDIITHINGNAITSPSELITIVGKYQPHDIINITYQRPTAPSSSTLTQQVTTAKLMPRRTKDIHGSIEEANLKSLLHRSWGLELKPLSNWRKSQLQLPTKQKGVLVYHVTPGLPADQQLIKPGYVITQLGSKKINNLKEFYQTAKELPGLPRVTYIRPQAFVEN